MNGLIFCNPILECQAFRIEIIEEYDNRSDNFRDELVIREEIDPGEQRYNSCAYSHSYEGKGK